MRCHSLYVAFVISLSSLKLLSVADHLKLAAIAGINELNICLNGKAVGKDIMIISVIIKDPAASKS